MQELVDGRSRAGLYQQHPSHVPTFNRPLEPHPGTLMSMPSLHQDHENIHSPLPIHRVDVIEGLRRSELRHNALSYEALNQDGSNCPDYGFSPASTIHGCVTPITDRRPSFLPWGRHSISVRSVDHAVSPQSMYTAESPRPLSHLEYAVDQLPRFRVSNLEVVSAATTRTSMNGEIVDATSSSLKWPRKLSFPRKHDAALVHGPVLSDETRRKSRSSFSRYVDRLRRDHPVDANDEMDIDTTASPQSDHVDGAVENNSASLDDSLRSAERRISELFFKVYKLTHHDDIIAPEGHIDYSKLPGSRNPNPLLEWILASPLLDAFVDSAQGSSGLMSPSPLYLNGAFDDHQSYLHEVPPPLALARDLHRLINANRKIAEDAKVSKDERRMRLPKLRTGSSVKSPRQKRNRSDRGIVKARLLHDEDVSPTDIAMYTDVDTPLSEPPPGKLTPLRQFSFEEALATVPVGDCASLQSDTSDAGEFTRADHEYMCSLLLPSPELSPGDVGGVDPLTIVHEFDRVRERKSSRKQSTFLDRDPEVQRWRNRMRIDSVVVGMFKSAKSRLSSTFKETSHKLTKPNPDTFMPDASPEKQDKTPNRGRGKRKMTRTSSAIRRTKRFLSPGRKRSSTVAGPEYRSGLGNVCGRSSEPTWNVENLRQKHRQYRRTERRLRKTFGNDVVGQVLRSEEYIQHRSIADAKEPGYLLKMLVCESAGVTDLHEHELRVLFGSDDVGEAMKTAGNDFEKAMFRLACPSTLDLDQSSLTMSGALPLAQQSSADATMNESEYLSDVLERARMREQWWRQECQRLQAQLNLDSAAVEAAHPPQSITFSMLRTGEEWKEALQLPHEGLHTSSEVQPLSPRNLNFKERAEEHQRRHSAYPKEVPSVEDMSRFDTRSTTALYSINLEEQEEGSKTYDSDEAAMSSPISSPTTPMQANFASPRVVYEDHTMESETDQPFEDARSTMSTDTVITTSKTHPIQHNTHPDQRDRQDFRRFLPSEPVTPDANSPSIRVIHPSDASNAAQASKPGRSREQKEKLDPFPGYTDPLAEWGSRNMSDNRAEIVDLMFQRDRAERDQVRKREGDRRRFSMVEVFGRGE